MNLAATIKTKPAVIKTVRQLAAAAKTSEDTERKLFLFLTGLTDQQRTEIFALWLLGNAGFRSFNVALASAMNQPPEHLAGRLAEKAGALAKCLARGMKRYRSQSL